MRYVDQTSFSDPGRYRELLDGLPADADGIGEVVRNLIVHYRSGVELSAERTDEINLRWVDAILACDQDRHRKPLAEPRPAEDRVAGCCRDFALLTVSALRHHGIPARTRIGFADYFIPGFHVDHVVTEYWNGQRWIRTDTQLAPAGRDFDPRDLPSGAFQTAAQVWQRFRAGAIDETTYGVAPGVPIGGGWFIRNYVHLEHAHLQGDEVLLWDDWGTMDGSLDGADLDLTDEIAGLLIAADAADTGPDSTSPARAELDKRYADDDRLHPAGRRVQTFSPTGTPPHSVDLVRPST